MKKIISVYILLLFISINLISQNNLKPFQWSDHLPYNVAYSVTHQGNVIYACSNECAFSYNEDDNSFQRLNKVTGLSDIEPVIIKNNPYNNTLLIIYKNSNIDIIKNGSIINAPDLLNKTNIGNKNVKSITFSKNLAYLSCAFGIVVYDTDALQVQDTYIIGPGGASLDIYQVALTPTTIYAATSKGIFYASLASQNLASYTNWSHVRQLPDTNGVYNGIVYFGGNILASYSRNLTTNQNAGNSTIDTLYQYNGSTWTKNPYNTVDGIKSLSVSDNAIRQLIVIDGSGFVSYDTLGDVKPMQYGFPGGWWTFPGDVIPDPKNSGWFWQADHVYGLLHFNNTSQKPAQYKINGPVSVGCAQVQVKNNKVIIAPSFLGYQKFNSYERYGVSTLTNGIWNMDIHSPPYAVFDIDCIAFDNNDQNHFYAGSFRRFCRDCQGL